MARSCYAIVVVEEDEVEVVEEVVEVEEVVVEVEDEDVEVLEDEVEVEVEVVELVVDEVVEVELDDDEVVEVDEVEDEVVEVVEVEEVVVDVDEVDDVEDEVVVKLKFVAVNWERENSAIGLRELCHYHPHPAGGRARFSLESTPETHIIRQGKLEDGIRWYDERNMRVGGRNGGRERIAVNRTAGERQRQRTRPPDLQLNPLTVLEDGLRPHAVREIRGERLPCARSDFADSVSRDPRDGIPVETCHRGWVGGRVPERVRFRLRLTSPAFPPVYPSDGISPVAMR